MTSHSVIEASLFFVLEAGFLTLVPLCSPSDPFQHGR